MTRMLKITRNKLDKLATYIELFNKDTLGYDEDALGRHKQVLDYLATELFPEKLSLYLYHSLCLFK
jgi:hypothetical protein